MNSDQTKTPMAAAQPNLSIEASLRFMTVAERSKLHLDIEMHRMNLWCDVYMHYIKRESAVFLPSEEANAAVRSFEKTFRPSTG